MQLRILTFNTWGGKAFNEERWPLIGKGMGALEPDLVGLQEVFQKDQAADLQKMIGIPEIAFANQESGLLIFSQFPIGESKIHQYQTVSPRESYSRYCQICQILPRAGQEFLFVVTHLSWKPEDASIREQQIRELIEWIDAEGSRLPCILVGDFNATPDSQEIQLLAKAGFLDTFSSIHPDDPGYTWSHSNPYTASHPELPERRIDHVFARIPSKRTLMVQSSKIVLNQPTANGIFPSDHFGVLTTLWLEE